MSTETKDAVRVERAQTPTPWFVTEMDSPYGHMIHGPFASLRDEAPHVGNAYRMPDAEFIVRAVNAHEVMLLALRDVREVLSRSGHDVSLVDAAISIAEGR